VLAHARAQHQSNPPRQATAASTEQTANPCCHAQEPSAKAGHRGSAGSRKSPAPKRTTTGKQQLQAQSKQLTCADSHKSQNKPQRQATAANTERAANMCWLTQEPSTNASRKGRQQLQALSKRLTCAGSQRAPPRQRKPQRQATAASTERAANMCWLTREPSTNESHT